MNARQFILAVGAAACMHCATAFGHAMLERSTPANNAVLNVAPKSIDLAFGHAGKLVVLKLQKDNEDVPLAATIPAVSAKTFSIPLPPLAPGKYLVTWGTVADDGHAMKGTVSFTITAH